MDSSKDITSLPVYVRQHFDRIAREEGFSEYEIHQHAGSNHGEGFMSALLRITVTGNRECNGTIKSDKLSLVCKLLPENIARRTQFSSVLIFQREIYFYTTVVPILCDFQERKGLTKENGFYAFPKCYGTTCDEANNEFIIIMEDLRADGFDLCGKDNRFEFENAKLLLTALGRLHGLSFALRDQEPEVFTKLQLYLSNDIILAMKKTATYQSFLTENLDLTIQSLHADLEIRMISTFRDSWMNIFDELLQPNVSEPFAVISQGDCWNNNMMFRNDSNNTAKDIRILDWQLARMQSPAIDLSLFILSTLTKSIRDQYLDELLQIYFCSLTEIIRKCGSVPEKLFSFADLQNQFQRFGTYGLVIAPLILQVLTSDSDDIVDMDAYAAEMDKYGKSSMNLANLKPESEAVFRQGVSDMIGDAFKFGWISAEAGQLN